MLVTDQFVFIHLPRTGGTFVGDVITKFFPSAHEVGYHLPLSLLPEEYSHLPILGTIRNPWEFYVSWYHHHQTSEGYSPLKNFLFCCVSEDRRLDFPQTIHNALDLGVSDAKLDSLIAALPEHFDYQKRNIPNVTKDVMQRIRGTRVGLYTFRFNEIFGQRDDIYFCRAESLRSDLMAFFEKIGAVSDALRNYITGADKRNISDHAHYSTYYTPVLAKLVSVRDRPLIDRFGFVFEADPSQTRGGAAAYR
jgi:hypothetical protein